MQVKLELVDGGVLLTNTSMVSNTENSMVLNVTEQALREYYEGGGKALIQEQFPELSPEEREFVKTGITPREWAALFGPDEE